jgi:hypothetical protein
VICFEVFRSVITVQREIRARFKKDTQHKNNSNGEAPVILYCEAG